MAVATSESTDVTTFVIEAQVAIDLAIGEGIIPPEHGLTAPYGSVCSAIERCRTAPGG